MPTRAAIQRWRIKRRERRRATIKNIKGSTPCADCGKTLPWWCMDFDHIPERGSKSFGINDVDRNPCMSEDRFLAELDKCEVVCANCHRTRTHYRSLMKADSSPAAKGDSHSRKRERRLAPVPVDEPLTPKGNEPTRIRHSA